MAGKLDSLGSLMECPICLEDFKDPRVLPCLHSLCKDCLEKHVSVSKQGDKFSCPSCRHECRIPEAGLSAIPKHFLLNNVRELLESKLKTSSEDAACGQSTTVVGHRVCDSAKFDTVPHGKVTFFCASCAEFYCETCASCHVKFAATRTHQLTPADEVDTKAVKAAIQHAKTPHCEHHPDLKLDLYCDTCRVPVCTKCCILTHKQHEHRELAQVAQGCKDKLTELSKRAATRIVILDKHLEELQTSRISIRRDTEKACQEVRQAADELRDLVTERERYLIQQIEDQEKAALLEVNAAAKETELTKDTIQNLHSYMQTVQESGSSTDQVVYTPGIQEQLHQQQVAPVKTVRLTASFKKETNSVSVVDAMLGTVSTESCVATTKPGTGAVSDTDVVEMELGAPVFTLKSTVGVNAVSGLIVLRECVCVTRFGENKLWIHNTATKTSNVHTLRGLSSWGLTGIGTNNTLVISDYKKTNKKRLHFVTLNQNTMDITTHTVKDITFQSHHISIHPANGQLVIADNMNKTIVTCDTQGKIQNSIKVRTDVDCMMCAVATDDGYVILDYSKSGRVHWVDSQGRVTHTYGQGPGEGLHYPWHMARGSQGQLVVADTCNHRLHLVDASGNLLCYLLTPGDCVQYPSCIWFEKATSLLYVAHGSRDNREIRVYKWPAAGLKLPLTSNATYTQHTLQVKLIRYK